MKVILVNEHDRVAIINKEDTIEMAKNFESIIKESLELCKKIFPNINPEVIVLEDDVYEHYSMLDEKDGHRIINDLLRRYFLDEK